jgi:zinc protease
MTRRRRLALWATQACGAMVFAGVASAQVVQWPSEGPPRPLPAREAKFPPYHLQTLPNGMQVVAVLHHEQPVVSIRMIVRAGGAVDPKDKLGVANLTAALLTMGAGAGTDLSFLNTVVMKDSFETGLRMLSDMARRPAFAPEEIERQRNQILSSLRVSFESPEYVADAVRTRGPSAARPNPSPASRATTLSRFTGSTTCPTTRCWRWSAT